MKLMLILISFTISWTFLLKTTELSGLVKDLNMQPSLSKKIEYDDYITKQSFDLSSELHINKYEMLFILNSAPEIREQYRNLTQSNYIPIPEPVTITSSLQSALFFHCHQNYNAQGARVRVGI